MDVKRLRNEIFKHFQQILDEAQQLDLDLVSKNYENQWLKQSMGLQSSSMESG